MSGLLSRPDEMRPLLFSQLQLTGRLSFSPLSLDQTTGRKIALPDDEAIAPRTAAAASALAKLGCIEVEMRRVLAFFETPTLSCFGEVPEIGPVHERNKKAWVHGVS